MLDIDNNFLYRYNLFYPEMYIRFIIRLQSKGDTLDLSKIKLIMKNNSIINNNWELIVALIIYTISASILLNYYLYLGADTISYINIAKTYASGNVFEAINGYWSPLFSWLMVPFFNLSSSQIQYVFITKIICIIIGFFTIISITRLYNKFEMDRTIKRVFLFTLIPVILYFSLTINTPDLLVVFILFYYLSIIYDSQYSTRLYFGIFCGVLGSLAYLTKSYLFFFFLAHFILFNMIYYWKSNSDVKKKVLKNLLLGLTVFFLISGLWIGAISDKYGKFTISTAGEYNQGIMGPEYMGHHPLYEVGLIEPPTNYSTSIWGEPSFTKMEHWSPLASMDTILYEFKLIEKNIFKSFLLIETFFTISIFIIISALIVILKSKADKLSKERILYLLITIFIYIGGYTLILVEWRYFWFIFVLIMFTGFYIVNTLFESKSINFNMRNILLIILILAFVFQPIYELFLFMDDEDPDYVLSNNLKNLGIQGGNLASNEEWVRMNGIAFYLNSKYYGIPEKTNNITNLEKELYDNRIDYFFVWNDTNFIIPGYREITGGKIKDLRIYSKI